MRWMRGDRGKRSAAIVSRSSAAIAARSSGERSGCIAAIMRRQGAMPSPAQPGHAAAMPRSRPMSTPTHPRALALIEQLAFRLAFGSVKSMPHPHEYTGRDKTDSARETAYVLLFRLIQGRRVRALAGPAEALPLPR